jgi:hypothetical protein
MLASEPRIFVREAVDFNIAARRDTELFSVLAISGAGIREVKGAMELAVVEFAVDGVEAFGSLVIALAVFGTDGFGAERDLIGFDALSTIHQG